MPEGAHTMEVLAAASAMVAILLVCSFFALSETALLSLPTVDREALKEDPHIGTQVKDCFSNRRKLLAGLLLGSEFANTALSATVAGAFALALPKYPWASVLVAGPLLIFFGDVVPKTLALRSPRELTRRIIRPLSLWIHLVRPLRASLEWLADTLLRPLGITPHPESEGVQEDQLRTLIDQGLQTGVIQPMEQELIHRVFDFGDLPVSRLMTPRPDVFSLSLTTPWSELLAGVRNAGFSRVPIWQSTPDNVLGILHVKDLLRLRHAPPPNARQLQKMLHTALFVPPSKRAADLLREFRARQIHIAIVVDEHGSIDGLVTLDDLLTELVGEMLDETDAIDPDVTEIAPGSWRVKGGLDIEDLEQRLGIVLPEGDYTTLGGFIFHQLGAAPQKGDEVSHNGIVMRVTAIEGRRITEATVTLPSDQPA